MKTVFRAFCWFVLPLCTWAANPIVLSPTAAWLQAERVADNVRNECDLPAFQIDTIKKHLTELSIPCSIASKDEVPATGMYLQVRIVDAISGGNAFIGHRKQVVTSAKLFVDGVEVAITTKTRDSMGGVGGGFKGSCSVLRRCCETLGKDVAEWVRDQPARRKDK